MSVVDCKALNACLGAVAVFGSAQQGNGCSKWVTWAADRMWHSSFQCKRSQPDFVIIMPNCLPLGAQVYVYHVGSRKIVARLALHKGIVRALVRAAVHDTTSQYVYTAVVQTDLHFCLRVSQQQVEFV
jgi:hypothetical protein